MSDEILFCGDTHGKLSHIVDVALGLKPMAVVLLGDIESPRPLHIELAPIKHLIWWITGNHDTDHAASWTHLVDSELADRCIDGRVVTLPDGTRLAGLGGVFREKIWLPPLDPIFTSYDAWLKSLQPGWNKRQGGKAPMFESERRKHRSTIFYDDYVQLYSQRADILVTHEAPDFHIHGSIALTELAHEIRAKITFHGHHHDRQDYSQKTSEMRAYGVGLRGITDRQGRVVIDGELDHLRSNRQ